MNVCVLALFACLLSVCCVSSLDAASKKQESSQLVKNLKAKKPQHLVCYGTSLTENGAWVTQVGDELKKQFPDLLTVTNSGGSGQYSKWGVANFEKRVLAKKPDTLIIEFSINDSVARFNFSIEEARKNLEYMIDTVLAQNKKCEIILMTMTPGDKNPVGHKSHRKDIELHYAMYRAVAKKRGLLLIDHYVNWKVLQTKDLAKFNALVPDSIHPTAQGCQEVVTPVILSALGVK